MTSMEIIKKGSKGEAVKTLQRALGITIDGVFGVQTEAAVKEFQKAHNLAVDGIVGAKTWDALSITDNKKVDPSVIYAPLTCCITRQPNRNIKYLAIHYTAGSSSAPGRAKTMKSYWESAKRASADFGVDDRDMIQFNPDPSNYKCWSVGDKKSSYSNGGSLYGVATNSNTISIEICSNIKHGASVSASNHDGWYFTEESLNNAVKLAKILMKKYNIPIERVVRHYDISGKLCPGLVGWNDDILYTTSGKQLKQKNNSSVWLEFKKRLV